MLPCGSGLITTVSTYKLSPLVAGNVEKMDGRHHLAFCCDPIYSAL